MNTNFAIALQNKFPNFRINDLTKQTDDPGNTELFVIFIPSGYDEHEETIPEIESLCQEHLTSEGDHHEEYHIMTQNNDIVLILNFNK